MLNHLQASLALLLARHDSVDVKKFIEFCPQCHSNKPSVNFKAPLKLHQESNPWSQIGVDLGPLTEIDDCRCVLPAVCYFFEMDQTRSINTRRTATTIYLKGRKGVI